jgi:hypothetical protein
MKDGVLLASDANQLRAFPPVFVIMTDCSVTPPVPFVDVVLALADSAGAATTPKLTPTTCGLPAMVALPLTPASEIEAV